MHRRTTILAALPQPRHATSAAAGVVASRRALNRAILPIEGARTHAPAISTGALAVFRAFQPAQPGPPAPGAGARLCSDRPPLDYDDLSVSLLLRTAVQYLS
jgi:hypothetical protein